MNRFQMKPLNLALLLASLTVVTAIGLFASRSQAADVAKPAAAAKAALTVSLVQAKSTQLPIKLAANGSVAAWQEASVGAESNGLRVAELKADVGNSVRRGQVLATFATESIQADVALARAALAEAQANAADALANADRARAVQGSGALSAQQVNQYLTTEQTAKARVDSAKAQLDAQLLRLKQTQVQAPDSGVISARSATVGSVVGAGTELFKLIRQGRLEWRAEVTASELSRIAPGTAVVVTAPGGAKRQGKVRMLAPTVDAATRNGLVYVDLVGPVTAGITAGGTAGSIAAAGAFKPGMFAQGEFALGNSGALTLPQTAVVVRDGFSYVYRVGDDQRVRQLKVQSGRVVGDQVEIQSGVKPEDKLVASGGSFLSDGDLVKVVDGAKPNAASSAAAK
jgi:RND family efflux transporter MFP subunit